MKKTILFFFLSMVIAGGCSTTRSPILYPNGHLNTVGAEQANRDIEECCLAAGAAAGSMFGHVGRGAAAGAAAGAASTVTHALFRIKDPDPVFMNYVNSCLSERGYQPIGWE
jgi:outer membrane lipoprotein SlyB